MSLRQDGDDRFVVHDLGNKWPSWICFAQKSEIDVAGMNGVFDGARRHLSKREGHGWITLPIAANRSGHSRQHDGRRHAERKAAGFTPRGPSRGFHGAFHLRENSPGVFKQRRARRSQSRGSSALE